MDLFNLELFDGHAIFQYENDIILVDTGSPISLRDQPAFSFLGETFNCSRSYGPASVSSISQQIGKEITMLMGNDILKKFGVMLDYRKKQIGFDSEPMLSYYADLGDSDDCREIPLEFDGLVKVKVGVHGQSCKMYLDTGARIGYVATRITGTMAPIRNTTDHHPTMGVFETPVFSLDTSLDPDINFSSEYGHLPAQLENAFLRGELAGILGYDFFNQYQVWLYLSQNALKACPFENTDIDKIF